MAASLLAWSGRLQIFGSGGSQHHAPPGAHHFVIFCAMSMLTPRPISVTLTARGSVINHQPMEANMSSIKRLVCFFTLVVLVAASGAYAQIGTINSAVVTPRVFNDVPGATFTPVNNYPALISFSEKNVSQATGFANRDVWQFSNTGGTSAYHFQNGNYFQASRS